MCTDQEVSLEERRHRIKQFQCRLGVLGSRLANFSEIPLQHRRLQTATSRRPIVFALEGFPLDRCVTLNCGIGVQCKRQLAAVRKVRPFPPER